MAWLGDFEQALVAARIKVEPYNQHAQGKGVARPYYATIQIGGLGALTGTGSRDQATLKIVCSERMSTDDQSLARKAVMAVVQQSPACFFVQAQPAALETAGARTYMVLNVTIQQNGAD